MKFNPYPFEKLNVLLKDVKPFDPNIKELPLTVGEPQFPTPDFIKETFVKNVALLHKYPKIAGEQILIDAQIGFVKRRFDIALKQSEIVTTMGTREALFNLPQFLLFDKISPIVAYPNPFYQIYEGAAIAARAKSVLLDLKEENGFKPEIDESVLSKCDMVILNSPSNPTTAVMSLEELEEWVLLSQKHNFVLINDECYSEVYFKSPVPPSLLAASVRVGNDSFKNILVFNSLSKRSSAPGLRSGFVAGDENLLSGYKRYRTYAGCAAGLPAQLAAAAAWADDEHVKSIQNAYHKNFQIYQNALNTPIPQATFYLWQKVGNGEEYAKKLYEETKIKVLPGAYLGRGGAGKEYVRLALVLDEQDMNEAVARMVDFLDKFGEMRGE